MSDTTYRQPSDQTALLLAKSRELLQLLSRLLSKRDMKLSPPKSAVNG
jgi:hypothetical protein